MNNTKEKSYGHGLLFDVIITLLLIGIIGAGLFFALRPKTENKVLIEYTVVFDSVKKEIAGNIMPNDEFLSENGEKMGIVSYSVVDNKVIRVFDKTSESDAEDRYKENVSDEYKTVKANITVYANYENGSYYAGGIAIRAGEHLILRLKDFYGDAYITDVTVRK